MRQLLSKHQRIIYYFVFAYILALAPCAVSAEKSECNVSAKVVMNGLSNNNLTIEQFEKAREICAKLALHGDPQAQYHLGGLNTVHIGNVYPNESEMFKWIKLSAENGYPAAQSFLGRSYETGKNFPQIKDIGLAIKWHTLAAEQQDLSSMVRLEEIYRKGLLGIQVDLEKADSWRKEIEKMK